MDALTKLKKITISSSGEKLRKVRSESPNSGSWLRRLKLGKSSSRKSLPNQNQIRAEIHINQGNLDEPMLYPYKQWNVTSCNNRSPEDSKVCFDIFFPFLDEKLKTIWKFSFFFWQFLFEFRTFFKYEPLWIWNFL